MTRAVLITRSQPGADETAARLEALGLEPVLTPMLEVVRLDPPEPSDVQAILVASRHAADRLADWFTAASGSKPPVYAVGGATADAARAAGADQVVSAEGDSTALVARVRADLDPAAGPLALLRGVDVGADVAGALGDAGFEVIAHQVYEARAADRLSPEAAAALAAERVSAALFHSARGARAFAQAVREAGLGEALSGAVAASLSERAGAPVADLPFKSHVTAVQPTEKSLLEALTGALNPRC
ncbi:MAG: uroporphyrinogen-III synthase [Maricaulaceae bacterium]